MQQDAEVPERSNEITLSIDAWDDIDFRKNNLPVFYKEQLNRLKTEYTKLVLDNTVSPSLFLDVIHTVFAFEQHAI